MSLLERVLACRRRDLSGLWPFVIEGRRYGWARPETARLLAEAGAAFEVGSDRLGLKAHLDTPAARTQAVDATLREVARGGGLEVWRGEQYAVVTEWGEPEALRVERAAAALLGIRAFGVHLNGWVQRPDGPWLWVAERSRTKASDPGKLDHLVAGGQPAGLSVRSNLAKECMEEAGVPPELAARALPMAPFRYLRSTPKGVRDDTLFVYDLKLPLDFAPQAMDGEVESFALMRAADVREHLRRTDDFKLNVGPCLLGFLLRHGVVDERDPEHAALLAELGGSVLEPGHPEPALPFGVRPSAADVG